MLAPYLKNEPFMGEKQKIHEKTMNGYYLYDEIKPYFYLNGINIKTYTFNINRI